MDESLEEENTDPSQGYDWHFSLAADSAEEAPGDRLTVMVRQQLAALLRCVTLTSHGADVRVTGFRFLGKPGLEHSLVPEDRERS